MRVMVVGTLGLSFLALACGGSVPASPSSAAVPTPLAPGNSLNAPSACTGDAWLFLWAQTSSDSYHLQVRSPSGTSVLDREGITASRFNWPEAPLLSEAGSAGWRWRVRAKTSNRYGDWSNETAFDVDPLHPRLVSPLRDSVMDNGCSNDTNATEWIFQWSSCAAADRYHVEISDSSGLYLTNDKLPTPAFDYRLNDYIANFDDSHWTWRVRARLNGDWGPWTPSQSFRVEPVNTDCSSLPPPTLVSPANGAVFSSFPRVTELKWSALPGAVRYRVEVETCGATDTLCVGPPVQGLTNIMDVQAASITFTFGGAQSGRWRVLAFSADGLASPWSETRYFRYTR